MSVFKNRTLIIGDATMLALITLAGFSTHGTLGSAGLRMLTTFFPLMVSWLLVSPHLGVFDPVCVSDPRQLWRPFWAMVIAAPLAAWMRAVLLGGVISPIFVVVIGGVCAISLLVWRAFYWSVTQRKKPSHG